MFLGHEVVMTEVLPQRYASGTHIDCLFGDLAMASKFGDRGGLQLATSTEADDFFKDDLIGIRGTERIAVNVHDIGNYSATAADRVAGPIVGFRTV
jgi:HK97 family phage major capsid protein